MFFHNPFPRLWLVGAALFLSACGAASTAPTANPTANPGSSSPTLTMATVTGHGAVLVAGSNGHTLYQFDMDVANSGTSACTGGCDTTWPPLLIPAGTTPTAAPGLIGTLGTIVLPGGLGTQVTYNGFPVHFYSGDNGPDQSNGNYPHWSVIPTTSEPPPNAATPSPAATPTPVQGVPTATPVVANPY